MRGPNRNWAETELTEILKKAEDLGNFRNCTETEQEINWSGVGTKPELNRV